MDEGIEHPELHILDVGLLEIVGVEAPHHTAPVLRGVVERTVVVEVGVEVVGSALVRVVGDVHHRERGGGTVVAALVAVGIELAHIDLTHVRVGEHRQVALDIRRGERGGTAREERVDGVPGHLRTVEARAQCGLVGALGEHRGHGGENPRGRVQDGYLVRGGLEVIDIRRIVLHVVCLACEELGKLTRERYLGRLRQVEERYLVEGVGEPLALVFPVDIETDDGVVHGLGSHGDLRRERLLGKVLDGTRELEVL